MPKCGVVIDLEGTAVVLATPCETLLPGNDWCRTWTGFCNGVCCCCPLIFKWYKLFVPLGAGMGSLSMVVTATMGLRASNGRVSIIPEIVSAGPTITLSQSSSRAEKDTCLSSSSMVSISSDGLPIEGVASGTLCLGIGGATVFGTSNSQHVIFSELRDNEADILVLDDKLTRLEAAVTLLVCGFSNRFTELSTLGDDFRGGNGGAAGSWPPSISFISADSALFSTLFKGNCCDTTDDEDADEVDDVVDINGALIRFKIVCDDVGCTMLGVILVPRFGFVALWLWLLLLLCCWLPLMECNEWVVVSTDCGICCCCSCCCCCWSWLA